MLPRSSRPHDFEMTQHAHSPATQLCPLCGAPVSPNARCDYDRPEDSSPALGDYDAMHKGLMTHEEHVLVVGRWSMHNAQSQKPAVLERFRPVVQAAWGKPQTLFPLDA